MMGPLYNPNQGFAITEGREYLILGLDFVNRRYMGTGVWVVYPDDGGQYGTAPLPFFEVVDPRVSASWRLSRGAEGTVSLIHPRLNEVYFMEDYYEPKPHIVAAFDEVVAELTREEQQWSPPTE